MAYCKCQQEFLFDVKKNPAIRARWRGTYKQKNSTLPSPITFLMVGPIYLCFGRGVAPTQKTLTLTPTQYISESEKAFLYTLFQTRLSRSQHPISDQMKHA